MLLKISALTLISVLLCSCKPAYATASAAAELDHDPIFSKTGYTRVGYKRDFAATHSYSVINTTGTDQEYHICYSLVVCPDYPLTREQIQHCFYVTVAPDKFSTDSGRTKISYSMRSSSWDYVCRIYAETEITDAEYGDKKDWQRFTVKP